MAAAVRRTLRRPSFWLVVCVLALITVPHYSQVLDPPSPAMDLADWLGLDRHAFERILYLAPIIWA